MTHTGGAALGPIQLVASLHETIWGGDNLREVAGKEIPPGAQIGESWETALDAAAANPPYAPKTLGDLVNAYGADLVGTRAMEVFGPRFPLLTKFIDARQDLSVQVHPDDAYAAKREGGKLGKTETWYILRADPGARVVYGMSRKVTPDEVRAAIRETRLDALLRHLPVQAGDVLFVPAGTVHAICCGVVLYELQEYSDITYRLYDYGRLQANGKPRELHVEQGLAVMRYGPAQSGPVRPVEAEELPGGTRRILVGCRYFLEEEVLFRGTVPGATSGASCHIITVLDGACEVRSDAGRVAARKGETVVLPATLGAYTLSGECARLIRSRVPQREDGDLAAWLAAQSFSVEV